MNYSYIPVVCMSVCKVGEFFILTSSVDVKVGGLVSHIACGLQTWSPGMHFAGVTHHLSYIDCVGTLVDVLTSEQHFDLRRKKQDKIETPLNTVVCPCCAE